jgi:hypothetical protein
MGFAKVISKSVFRDQIDVGWVLKGLLACECRCLMQEKKGDLG